MYHGHHQIPYEYIVSDRLDVEDEDVRMVLRL